LNADFPLKNGDANKNISVACWMNAPDGGSLMVGRAIFSKGGAAGKYSFAVCFAETSGSGTGRIKVLIGKDGGTNHDIFTNSSKTLERNAWYHVAASYEDHGTGGTVRIRIYDPSDGSVEQTALAAGNSIHVSDGDVKVAAYRYSGHRFTGLVDELVVFNDILTEGEIDQIRQGSHSFASDPHLVARWRFEAGSLSTDASGSIIDLFKQHIEQKISVGSFVDTWLYHDGAGNIHCGTNAKRDIGPWDWWN
jgi:hypothetical protein